MLHCVPLTLFHPGIASRALLDTYSEERQPVGQGIVLQANDSYRAQLEVWKALDVLTTDPATCKANLHDLVESTDAGRSRREAFQRALHGLRIEFHALGTEMGQRYESRAALQSPGDAEKETAWSKRDKETQSLEYLPSTQPGRRLPHAWLNVRHPRETLVSTQDLSGKGSFVLFTGHGGDHWRTAATRVTNATKIDIKVHSIGMGLEWEDVYGEWERLRGVEEDGCVLVRPDRFVAWRSRNVLEDEDKCSVKLQEVLRSILGWEMPISNGIH
jgi:hypothetical protein